MGCYFSAQVMVTLASKTLRPHFDQHRLRLHRARHEHGRAGSPPPSTMVRTLAHFGACRGGVKLSAPQCIGDGLLARLIEHRFVFADLGV